jgi:hypothetical protein
MSEINSLKEAFNRGEYLDIISESTLIQGIYVGQSPINSSTDIYAVCDVIKSYFRTLPDPVIPSSMYFDFIATASKPIPHLESNGIPTFSLEIEDLEPRLDKIRSLVQSLPYANFDLLKRLIEHLDKWASCSILQVCYLTLVSQGYRLRRNESNDVVFSFHCDQSKHPSCPSRRLCHYNG